METTEKYQPNDQELPEQSTETGGSSEPDQPAAGKQPEESATDQEFPVDGEVIQEKSE